LGGGGGGGGGVGFSITSAGKSPCCGPGEASRKLSNKKGGGKGTFSFPVDKESVKKAQQWRRSFYFLKTLQRRGIGKKKGGKVVREKKRVVAKEKRNGIREMPAAEEEPEWFPKKEIYSRPGSGKKLMSGSAFRQ